MSNLRSDASTPLHKFDIVQVVLHPTQVTETECHKRSMSSPVKVFLFLYHLQYE